MKRYPLSAGVEVQNPHFFSPYRVDALVEDRYQNGDGTAVLAEVTMPSDDTDEPDDFKERIVVSINIVEKLDMLEPGEFFLKNYSEGQFVAEALIAAGHIRVTGNFATNGYVTVPVCRIDDKLVGIEAA